MRAGELKYRIEILKPVYTQSSTGAKTVRFEPMATVWAERQKFSGRRSYEVGEVFADYDASYNIRIAHTVEENWRVRQLGGYLYSVTNIIPNIDRGMKTLQCVRVNE